jgi:hypothetical protein
MKTEAQKLALSAATQAADATAELLVFAREGPLAARGNFNNEPIEKLADACKLALEIEMAGGRDDERNQLHSALCRYLDGWMG